MFLEMLPVNNSDSYSALTSHLITLQWKAVYQLRRLQLKAKVEQVPQGGRKAYGVKQWPCCDCVVTPAAEIMNPSSGVMTAS